MSNSSYKCNKTLEGHQGSVLVVKYNSDGGYCLSGSQDKTIKLWNPSKGSMVYSFEGHGYSVLDIQTAPDNKTIFSCAEKQLYQWDIETGEIIKRFNNAHTQTINCIAVNKDTKLLFSGSSDRLVKVWDLRIRDPIQVLDDAKDTITGVYINETPIVVPQTQCHGHSHGSGNHGHSHGGPPPSIPSDKEVITSSVDGCIRTYDVRMGTLAIDQEEFPVSSMTLTNDKKCFIASSNDSKIRLIDRDSYDILKEYKSHTNQTYKINCKSNYDDSMIVSGSEDNDIYIWDTLNSNLLTKLSGHTNVITSIDTHPTKNHFISSSTDGTIKVWIPSNEY